MQVKDHYKTLGISPGAGPGEIKSAWRRMVRRYHPDRNSDDQFAVSYFRDIQEAYQVLSHPAKKAAYDSLRTGYIRPRQSGKAPTPESVLRESLRFAASCRTPYTSRPGRDEILAGLEMLLSPAHMAMLLLEDDRETNRRIVRELIEITGPAELRAFQKFTGRFESLSGDDSALLRRIRQLTEIKMREAQWLRVKPWLIVALPVLLCLFMYLFIRRFS